MAEIDAFSTQDTIDIAQQQIDQQLATLLDMVSILRQRRNALSLVSRLPAEILCTIFEIARDEDELHNASPKMCISISQVCSAWRNTAMQFQGMWNFIHYNYKLEWVRELLVRSGTAPLRVDLDAEANEDMVPLIFSDAVSRRFQKLTFGGFLPLEFETRCRSILGCHAPLLETLHISFDSDHNSIMHERLFSGGTPRLRELTLRNCPLPWNSPMLKSPLTHLILELPTEAAATTWTMSQLTDVLENLPALRELVLCDVLAPMEALTTPIALPRRNIPLLHLEELSIIADTFAQCTYLLDRLSLTPTPFIRLDGCFNKSQSWTVQSFVDSLSSIHDMLRLQHSVDADTSPGPLRRVFLTSNYAYSLTFAAWSNVEPIPHVHQRPVINLLLPGYTQDVLSISGLMAALPLRGLQKIVFHHDFPQEWLQVLASLEHIHTIRITNVRQGSSVLKWLAQESPAPFPFHALSRLEMISCTLNSSHGTDESTFALLQNVLRRRHGHGHGIAVLYLNECGVKEHQLLELGQFVGRVICDPWLNTAVPRYDSDASDDGDLNRLATL